MDLEKRIADAAARRDKAKALISEDDREEIRQRNELAKIEREAEESAREARDLSLERRMDAAKESLPDDVKVKSVTIREFPDTFIVMRNGKAHATWQDGIQRSAINKNFDRAANSRTYALAVVYDWNGRSDFDNNPDLSRSLLKFFEDNPGIVTPIVDAAAELAGVFAEERKS